MTHLRDRIHKLDDFQAVHALAHIRDVLFEGMDSSLDDVLKAVPPDVAALPEFQQLLAAMETADSASLPSADSVRIARGTLELLADREEWAPILETALGSFRDNKAFALEILAIGTAISMIIMAATTTFKFKGKGYEVGKGAASKDQLVPIADMVKATAAAITAVASPNTPAA